MANNKLRTLVMPGGEAYDVTVDVTNSAPTLAWNTTSTIGTVDGVNLTVKLPANPNSNTTYTVATGDSNGQIKVTPSSGSAYNVSVKGLGSAAYTASSAYATAGHTHATIDAATLTGTVPTSCLPAYVDDVLEYTAKANFPSTGETGKIYVDTATNKTYRWSGSAYVEISASLALGTTSSTAYRGDYGNTAYTHSQKTSGNPHNVTKSDVGLGNVDNTADAVKSVAYAETAGNADTVNGLEVLTAVPSGAKFTDTVYTHPTHTSKTSGLYKITVDSLGHVSAATAVSKSDITALGIPSTDTNTHYTTKLYATSSSGTANASTTNGNTYLRLFDDSTARSSIKIIGGGATTVTSDASGNITISSTDTNTDTNTTYSISKSGSTITLTGSDGSTTSVTDSDTNTTYAQATTTTLGLVKSAANRTTSISPTTGGTTSNRYYGVELDTDGTMFVNVPWSDTNTNYYHSPSYTSGLSIATGSGVSAMYVPTAGANTLGAVKGYHRTSGTATGTQTTTATDAPAIAARTTTSGRYYGVETDATGAMFVNVPWTNTNTYMSQYHTTTSANYPLLFKYSSGITSTTTTSNYGRYANNVYVNPSTGTIYATKFEGQCSIDDGEL